MIHNLTLYADHPDGPLHVLFDEDAHTYTVNGERWPGVTSALDAIDLGKSGAFAWWSANTYRDYLYTNWPTDPTTGQPRYVSPSEAVRLIEEGRKQHAAKKEEARTIGSDVHDWIEAHIKATLTFRESPPLPENEQARNAAMAHLEMEKSRRIHYLGVETIVASRQHRYIGKLDAACVLAEVDGVPTLEDHKTSNDIRLTYRPQLAAYAMAWNEEHPDKPVWRRQVNLLGKETATYEQIDLCYPGMTDEQSTRLDFEAYLRALWLTQEWGKVALAAMPKRGKKPKYIPPVAWAKGIK